MTVLRPSVVILGAGPAAMSCAYLCRYLGIDFRLVVLGAGSRFSLDLGGERGCFALPLGSGVGGGFRVWGGRVVWDDELLSRVSRLKYSAAFAAMLEQSMGIRLAPAGEGCLRWGLVAAPSTVAIGLIEALDPIVLSTVHLSDDGVVRGECAKTGVELVISPQRCGLVCCGALSTPRVFASLTGYVSGGVVRDHWMSLVPLGDGEARFLGPIRAATGVYRREGDIDPSHVVAVRHIALGLMGERFADVYHLVAGRSLRALLWSSPSIFRHLGRALYDRVGGIGRESTAYGFRVRSGLEDCGRVEWSVDGSGCLAFPSVPHRDMPCFHYFGSMFDSGVVRDPYHVGVVCIDNWYPADVSVVGDTRDLNTTLVSMYAAWVVSEAALS
jgi:hypothetical protein